VKETIKEGMTPSQIVVLLLFGLSKTIFSERVNFQSSISNDTKTSSDQCQNKVGFDNQCRNWKKTIPGVCSDKFMMDNCKGTCHEECEFGIRFHTGAIKAASTCYGTLTIKHADENDISRVKELNLSPIGGHKRDGAYPKIKKGFSILKKNIVIKLIRNGDCCWEIYEKPYFRGEKQYLGHSENYPDIQPESLKKVDCRAS